MICIISVTAKGDILGEKVKNHFGGELYCKSKIADFKLDSISKECFEKYDSIIFISSTGIAVRAIAKYLERKDKDPAVVVVDVCNKFSISLVSGHLGGANNLTISVAKLLNNTPVITTATDNMDILAPDVIAMNNNLIIDDLKLAKVIASRLVNNEEVYFKDDKNLINCPKIYTQVDNLRNYTLWITNRYKTVYKSKGEENFKVICNNSILKLIRKDIVLGIGCRRNTDKDKMYEFVKLSLEENNLDLRAIALISSIDIKQDENAILSLKEKLNCDIKFFTKEEIASVEDKYEGSEFVKKTVGVSSVSEPVVELCGGTILVKKIKKDGMTLTIGELI